LSHINSNFEDENRRDDVQKERANTEKERDEERTNASHQQRLIKETNDRLDEKTEEIRKEFNAQRKYNEAQEKASKVRLHLLLLDEIKS
jgi:hypothetical protein